MVQLIMEGRYFKLQAYCNNAASLTEGRFDESVSLTHQQHDGKLFEPTKLVQ
jgi:hypothetical protein